MEQITYERFKACFTSYGSEVVDKTAPQFIVRKLSYGLWLLSDVDPLYTQMCIGFIQGHMQVNQDSF